MSVNLSFKRNSAPKFKSVKDGKITALNRLTNFTQNTNIIEKIYKGLKNALKEFHQIGKFVHRDVKLDNVAIKLNKERKFDQPRPPVCLQRYPALLVFVYPAGRRYAG